MRTRPRRPSALTILVGAMLVLLPLLAFLQYRWLGQLSAAEGERLQRSLGASAKDFTRAMDLQFALALGGLQMEGSTLQEEAWDRFAERVTAWRLAADRRMLQDLLLVDRGPGGRALRLRRWDPAARTFVAAEWPADLASTRERLEASLAEFRKQAEPIGMNPADLLSADASVMVIPVTPVIDPAAAPSGAPAPAPVPVFGYTIARFDLEHVTREMLPALVARHFGPVESTPYRVAVVSRTDPTAVLYETDEGAAQVLAEHHDVSHVFFGMSPDVFPLMRQAMSSLHPHRGEGRRTIFSVFSRRGPSDRRPPEDHGRWTLLVRHRAGSLEAAVVAARQRNLGLAFGILLLMGAAIALIVVAARRAEALARQQLEFVAGVSHELRTPVTVISSAADNLAQGVVSDPARVKQYGAAIQGEARRLGDTVERVLQYAGLDAGRGVGHPVPLDVSGVIADALAASEPLIREGSVTLETAIEAGLPPVLGDAAALRSSIQNLVANAVKYGGNARWVRVSARQSGGRRPEVAIRVEDRGLGIGGRDLPHVFEPFYRGAEAVSRQIQGNGLGLSIVKRVIEAHGGSVSVESQPGSGSTFTMRLPAAPAEGREAPSPLGEHARARA